MDDLACVWCEYGEMELRHENYDQALRILRVSPALLGIGGLMGVAMWGTRASARQPSLRLLESPGRVEERGTS